MADFLDVLAGFGKLILLLNRVNDRRLIVTLFNLAYTKVNGKTEENIAK